MDDSKPNGVGHKRGLRKAASGIIGKVNQATGANLSSEVREFAEVYGEVLLGLHADVHSIESATGTRLAEVEARIAALEANAGRVEDLQSQLGRSERETVSVPSSRAGWALLLALVSLVIAVGTLAWILAYVR